MRVTMFHLFALSLITVLLLPHSVRAQDGGSAGRIAIPRGADVMIVDVATGQDRLLTLEGDALISSVTWAPSGNSLAAARSSRPSGDPAFGQDVDILDSVTGAVVSSIRRDKSGVILDFPVWTADSQWLFYERQEALRTGLDVRIERARPNGADRSTVVVNGHSPILSPDGTRLGFVRSDKMDMLYMASVDGQDVRPILPEGRFILLAYPRFSPDGQWIVFATVSELGRTDPSGSAETPPWMRHGVPWDIWMVRADGTDLMVVRQGEDDPSLAWAPDGSGIAMFSSRGLAFIQRTGEIRSLKDDIIGFGGIDWAP